MICFLLQVQNDLVFYVADQNVHDVDELFRVPSDGSAAPVTMNGPLVTGGDVWAIYSANDRVVYLANQDNVRCGPFLPLAV